jgi:hypothetical protein
MKFLENLIIGMKLERVTRRHTHKVCFLPTRKEIILKIIIFISVSFRSRKPKLTAVGIRCADHATSSIR